jgi:hypothetical protein
MKLMRGDERIAFAITLKISDQTCWFSCRSTLLPKLTNRQVSFGYSAEADISGLLKAA